MVSPRPLDPCLWLHSNTPVHTVLHVEIPSRPGPYLYPHTHTLPLQFKPSSISINHVHSTVDQKPGCIVGNPHSSPSAVFLIKVQRKDLLRALKFQALNNSSGQHWYLTHSHVSGCLTLAFDSFTFFHSIFPSLRPHPCCRLSLFMIHFALSSVNMWPHSKKKSVFPLDIFLPTFPHLGNVNDLTDTGLYADLTV